MAEIMNTPDLWMRYCPGCNQECQFIDYPIRISSSLAPPTYMMDGIKQFVESRGIPLTDTWNTTWKSDIATSYVSLEVAYETSRSEVYDQQPTIGPVDVISNVGGQTGLWIGISFLSLMELAEMLFRLLRSQGCRLWTRARRVFPAQDTPL